MRTSQAVPFWIREIVLINAAAFLAFGPAFILFPAQLAGLTDVVASSPSALADVRAMYGGLSLAAGVLFLFGLRRADWFLPALFLVMASSGALALARLYSIAASGVPSGLVLGVLASEVASFVWALLGYRALTANGAARLGNLAAPPVS